jgi:hypothetical protein
MGQAMTKEESGIPVLYHRVVKNVAQFWTLREQKGDVAEP